MVSCVLVPVGDDSGRIIATYETAVLPAAGDTVTVSAWSEGGPRETRLWVVADGPRTWRVFDHATTYGQTPVVFIACYPAPEEA